MSSWLTTGISIARKIINQPIDSNEHISRFKSYIDQLGNSDLLLQILELLEWLGSNMTYSHIICAYYQAYVISDLSKGIFVAEPTYNAPPIIEDVREILKYDSLNSVPLTTSTGAFGYDTFLLLYFNDYYPIACTLTPYPVHRGGYPGSTGILQHDFTHNYQLRKYSWVRDILKPVYFSERLVGNDRKIVIITMFFYFHEFGDPELLIKDYPETEGDIEDEEISLYEIYGNLVELPAMLSVCEPEEFGLDSTLIPDIDFLNTSARELSLYNEAFRYKDTFLRKGVDIIHSYQ